MTSLCLTSKRLGKLFGIVFGRSSLKHRPPQMQKPKCEKSPPNSLKGSFLQDLQVIESLSHRCCGNISQLRFCLVNTRPNSMQTMTLLDHSGSALLHDIQQFHPALVHPQRDRDPTSQQSAPLSFQAPGGNSSGPKEAAITKVKL